MKGLILFIGFLCITCLESKAQMFLNSSEDGIKSSMLRNNAYFNGKKYTYDGVAFLSFSYPSSEIDRNDIAIEAFYLSDQNLCVSYKVYYYTDRFLDSIVE